MAPSESWLIETTDEYYEWFAGLDDRNQDAVRADIEVLEKMGPHLGRPYVDSIKGSKHPNMKELRTMTGRRHLRSFFAFDPRRAAILLIGGDKTGDKGFYRRLVPLADRLLEEHLAQLRKEGLT